MKKFLKIAIFVVIIYLAYKYYVDNFTIEGKKKKLEGEQELLAPYQDIANQMKSDALANGYNVCNNNFQSGVYEWDRVAQCKIDVETQVNNTDWLSLAMNK